jgi:uncharacterized protein
MIGLAVDERRLADVCERYGIASIEVFGSVARGEDRPGSDIDLLYELRSGARLGWKIEKLTDELAELFGRPVDLVSKRGLHARLRSRVLADAVPLVRRLHTVLAELDADDPERARDRDASDQQ